MPTRAEGARWLALQVHVGAEWHTRRSASSVAQLGPDRFRSNNDSLTSTEHVLDLMLCKRPSKALVRGGEGNDAAHLIYGVDQKVEVVVGGLRRRVGLTASIGVRVVEVCARPLAWHAGLNARG